MPSLTSRRTAACLGLLVLVLAATLAACDGSTSASQAASATPSASSASCEPDEIAMSGIDGIVVDSDGNPLEDVLVQIDAGDGFTGDAHTTADGTFSAEGVTGDFVITTVDIAYDSVTRRVSVPCGETVDVELVLTPTGG
jgi:hypothetical protein